MTISGVGDVELVDENSVELCVVGVSERHSQGVNAGRILDFRSRVPVELVDENVVELADMTTPPARAGGEVEEVVVRGSTESR